MKKKSAKAKTTRIKAKPPIPYFLQLQVRRDDTGATVACGIPFTSRTIEGFSAVVAGPLLRFLQSPAGLETLGWFGIPPEGIAQIQALWAQIDGLGASPGPKPKSGAGRPRRSHLHVVKEAEERDPIQ